MDEALTSTEVMLTTHDNPYNPFEQFNQWFMYDIEKGYNTCGHLARVVNITSDMSQVEIDRATDEAIDKIIHNDFLNMYKKVTPETAKAGPTNI